MTNITAIIMESQISTTLRRFPKGNPKYHALTELEDLYEDLHLRCMNYGWYTHFMVRNALKECGLILSNGEFHQQLYDKCWIVDVWDTNPDQSDVREEVFVTEAAYEPLRQVIIEYAHLIHGLPYPDSGE